MKDSDTLLRQVDKTNMTKMATPKQIATLMSFGIEPEDARGMTSVLASAKIARLCGKVANGATPKKHSTFEMPLKVEHKPSLLERPAFASTFKQVGMLVHLGVPRAQALRMSKQQATKRIGNLLERAGERDNNYRPPPTNNKAKSGWENV